MHVVKSCICSSFQTFRDQTVKSSMQYCSSSRRSSGGGSHLSLHLYLGPSMSVASMATEECVRACVCVVMGFFDSPDRNKENAGAEGPTVQPSSPFLPFYISLFLYRSHSSLPVPRPYKPRPIQRPFRLLVAVLLLPALRSLPTSPSCRCCCRTP